MKKLLFLLLSVSLVLVSCDNDENAKENLQNKITTKSTKEEDFTTLENMRKEIIDFTKINTITCTNEQNWAMIKLDASQCSGNAGYILYYKQVDLTILEKKISEYNLAQGKVYEKWKILVDFCADVEKPNSIRCVDNKPQLFTNPALD